MALEIPLVVALWEHPNFGGRKRLIVQDTRNLALTEFANTTSAIGVHPGPNYAAWKAAHGGQEPAVGLYDGVNFTGAALILTAGAYPDIGRLFNFNDAISSIRFNPPPPNAAPIGPIPLVVELYADESFTGRRLVVVEDTPNIAAAFGGEFNDVTTSVRVQEGPDYRPGKKAQLFRDLNYEGGKIDLAPGNYPDLKSVGIGFNDVVSSVKVR
jgi:hypothetical protein